MSKSERVDVVQRRYAAVADRDLDAASRCLSDDAVRVLPGTSSTAGTRQG